MKKIFMIFALLISLYADNIYFMPFQGKDALKELTKSIDLAKNRIDIAIYSFTNWTIAKHLKYAAKRGIKIRIIFDKESNLRNKRSELRYLSKYRNIKTFIISGKPYKHNQDDFGLMHMKLMIIDNKRVIFGSANYSYSAFHNNYELIYFKDDYRLAKIAEKFYERVLAKAKEY